MTPRILILLFLSTLFPCAKAYTIFNLSNENIEQSLTPPVYEVKCDTITNGFRITYEFSGVGLVKDSADTYRCYISGFGNNSIPNMPDIPVLTERILIPAECEYTLSITESVSVDRDMVIANSIFEDSITFDYNSTDNGHDLYSQPITLGDIQIYRGNYFLYYRISPVLYDSEQKRTKFFKKISFDLLEKPKTNLYSLSNSASPRPAISPYALEALNNRDSYTNYLANLNHGESFLIFTVDSLYKASEKFAEWKRLLGYDVQIKCQKVWINSQVFEEIKNWYSSTPSAKYILFIGDQGAIPEKPAPYRSYIQVTSHLYYACMDGENDCIPDLIYGRIPAKNSTQANNAIDKIISYEKKPNGDRNYSRFANMSYFETKEPNDTMECTSAFVFHAENIHLSMHSLFDESRRMYYCEPKITPLYWNNINSNGEPLPSYLKKPNFSWESNDDAIQEFKNNPNLIFFSSHGDPAAWRFPFLYTADMHKLNNKIYPILYSICCSTGQYTHPNCLASALLFLKDTGCASIIAATDATFIKYNEAMYVGISNTLWPFLNLDYNNHYYFNNSWKLSTEYTGSIGESVISGFEHMARKLGAPQFKKIGRNTTLANMERYYVVGDPSLYCFWDAKTSVKDISTIEYSNSSINVTVKGKPAIISFYDKETKRHARKYGYTSSFNCVSPENIYISISVAGAQLHHGWFNDLKKNQATSSAIPVNVTSCEVGSGKMTCSFNCKGEEYKDIKINVALLHNGTVNPVYSQEHPTANPFTLSLPETASGSMFIVVMKWGEDTIYTKKFIL